VQLLLLQAVTYTRIQRCYCPFHSVVNGSSPEGVLFVMDGYTLYYMIELLSEVDRLGICCNVGGLFVNIFSYVRDCVACSASI